VRLSEVEAVRWRGTELSWLPLRGALGTRIVGMAAFVAEREGQLLVEEHREAGEGRGHEEVYVVLAGRASFALDGTELDARAGTLVMVEPDVRRSAVAAEPGTTVLVLGGPPTFPPAADEWLERARPHLRTDPERARRILDDLRQALPDSPGVAIGEALLAAATGDEATARRELRQLLERNPELRDALAEDPDLGPVLNCRTFYME
jgi:hypothetical protein